VVGKVLSLKIQSQNVSVHGGERYTFRAWRAGGWTLAAFAGKKGGQRRWEERGGENVLEL